MDLEERFELLFGRMRIHIFDDEIEHLHRFFELVSAFLQFQRSLLFSLGLSDVKTGLDVAIFFFARLTVSTVLIKSFLSILPVSEADEPKALALLVLILHDHGAHDLSEVNENCFEILVCEISSWKILDVEVGAASRLLKTITILLGHVLSD